MLSYNFSNLKSGTSDSLFIVPSTAIFVIIASNSVFFAVSCISFSILPVIIIDSTLDFTTFIAVFFILSSIDNDGGDGNADAGVPGADGVPIADDVPVIV